MLLNEGPPANSLRIPAAPAFIPSQASKPRIRICSKCGFVLPQDFPWIVCDDCQFRVRAVMPSPGETLLASQDPARHGQSGRLFSTCVACQIVIEVPKTTTTSYTLCPACRTRQEGIKLKPTRRIDPISNTVHPPPPPNLITFPIIEPPRDPPRPCFFSSRGEIVAPSPAPVPVVVPPVMSTALVRVCMRFGCGVQLAPDQLFNFCEACLRLGFGRGMPAPPPPPQRLPKRMRRDEFPSGVLISKVKRDVDAAQRAEAPMQHPPEESADTDDDLDLELMYPEDEELAARSSVDSAAKTVGDPVSPPEAVLERGRLLLLPLAHSPPTRSPSPQPVTRTCETLGCGGTVSPSATWQRCYHCTLQRWKERQRAAIAVSAVMEPASPVVGKYEVASNSGEVMGGGGPASLNTLEATLVDRVATSNEPGALSLHSQEAVLNAVDTLPLLELPDGRVDVDTAVAARTSSTLNTECGRDATAEPETIKISISGWDSDLTNLSSEDEEVESDSDAEDSSVFKIRIPVLASRLPVGANARVCAIKRCNIVLRPDQRYKICDSCRRYQREYQRIRAERARRRMEEFSQIAHGSTLVRKPPAPPSGSEIPLLEAQNDEATTAEGLRICAVPRCRARLQPVSKYRWKCCGACRAHARDTARRSSVGDILDLEDPVEQTSSSAVSPFPTFQNRSVLLSEFSAMLGRFMEAQILYLRVKLQTAGEKALSRLDPVLFAFDGEYSTVTGQRGDQANSQGKCGPEHSQEAEMQKDAALVVKELDSTLLTEFKPTEGFIIKSGGVIMRYKCALELIVPLRPLPNSTDNGAPTPSEGDTSSSHVPYMKPVFGELEVAIIPDDSHRSLLGRRTIIRFRMLG
ncbi:uncharacterized protein EDB91DRAFT_1163173 [Suillus paluster]|uniref:uncharacterized protein n=1 Tax=Suillus paluster TaxID=48578 RepID=UPI001B8811A5|nr:uncharacterized protein EDB91DRAFT_1163173 [Suillus paluster]KAG1727766.1 hypothetical protein EDB91DRAFT_1163173 [Suillus paluster]